MSSADAQPELHDIQLVDLPLDVLARSQEHNDGLTREFALIATSLAGDSVPQRLQQLSDQLQTQYAMYTEETRQRIDAAILQGERELDVIYTVPGDVLGACFLLNDMLEEADDFCRKGDLLTLATPPDLVRFRRWFLGEFVRQISGDAPVPWRDYADDWPPVPPPDRQ